MGSGTPGGGVEELTVPASTRVVAAVVGFFRAPLAPRRTHAVRNELANKMAMLPAMRRPFVLVVRRVSASPESWVLKSLGGLVSAAVTARAWAARGSLARHCVSIVSSLRWSSSGSVELLASASAAGVL